MKFIFAVAAIAAATPAFAQDAINFATGPRIEVQVGWDRPTASLSVSDGVSTYSESAGKSGVTFGGEIGYDVPLSPISFAGVYGGVSGATTKECGEYLVAGDEACISAGRNFTAGLRAGFLVSNSTAIYAKGGYSNGRINLSYADPSDPTDNFKVGGNLDGYHVGAGVEFGMQSRLYGKVEYVYSNYGEYSYVDGTDSLTLGLDRHQVVAGLGYRF